MAHRAAPGGHRLSVEPFCRCPQVMTGIRALRSTTRCARTQMHPSDDPVPAVGRQNTMLETKISLPPAAARHDKPPLDPRTRVLIEGPIVPTLVRLAIPNVLVMAVQASVGLIETYFVGWLGTDALAGVALVFPLVMLMQMMSAGAMGGGISAAVARALGAGRRADADALVLHAFAIGLVLGLVFMLAM